MVGGNKVSGIILASGGSRISQTGGGAPTSKVGAKTYYLAKLFRKLHENERIWTGGRGSLAPPLRSATASSLILQLVTTQYNCLWKKSASTTNVCRYMHKEVQKVTQLPYRPPRDQHVPHQG